MAAFKTPLSGALYYAKHGLPVFPVRGNNEPDPEKAKRPVHGFTDWEKRATTDEKQIRAWAKQYPDCNWGFPAGRAGVVVLDLDRKPDRPDGFKSFEEWKAKQDEPVPEDTFTVSTPSGGLHLYYAAKGVSSCNGFLPSFDIKSVGGYVLVPGSVVNGKRYEITNEKPVQALPASVRFSKKGEKKDAPSATTTAPASSDDFAVALEELLTMEQSNQVVPCGKRDETLYRMCAEWRQRGLGHAARVRLLDIMNAMHLIDQSPDDPMGTEKFEDISRHTDRYATEAFGSKSIDAVFGENYMLEGTKDWRGLAEMEVPERYWLIKDWLLGEPGTVSLFSGQGGTGKSLIGLMLAYSLATGVPWLGVDIQHTTKCLFITCEDSEQEVIRRVKRIEKRFGKPVGQGTVVIGCRSGQDNLIAYTDPSNIVKTSVFLKNLERTCKTVFGTQGGLLILDTLADFAAINENDRTQVSQFIKHTIVKMALDTGCSVLILAHPNKGNTGYSGSSAWEGAVRTRLELSWADPKQIGGPLRLSLSKSNASMAGKEILLRYDPTDYLPTVIRGEVEESAIKEAILAKIDEAYKGECPFKKSANSTRPVSKMKVEHPVLETPIPEADIKGFVDELIEEGKIGMDRKGFLYVGANKSKK